MKRVATLSLVCITVACLGCGMVKSTKRTLATKTPVATVDSVKVAEQTAEGARIETMVRLENPNPSEHLPLLSAEYQVSVAGQTYRYRDVPMRTLPSQKNMGHQVVVLAAALPTAGSTLSGAAYSVSGRIYYEPPGEIRRLLTDSGVPLPSVAFSDSGTLQ